MILDDFAEGRMAPKKSGKKELSDTEDYEDDEDYRKKRDRNNQAVKRSRFKSKQKTAETQDRINRLKGENAALQDKVKGLAKELGLLKELFLSSAANVPNPKLDGVNLEELLAADPEDTPSKS